MKNLSIVFAIFCAVLVVSCGSSKNDNNAVSNFGKLGQECYPNKTCDEGLLCDTINNVCIEDPENPINDSDKTDSGSTEKPDSDSDLENSDTLSDGGDSQPDDTDTTSDGDDSSECKPNPCKDLQNSTGNCSTNFYTSIPTNFYNQ